MVARWACIIALVAAAVAGCAPNLDGGASLVNRSQVIAISSEPAEAKPGDVVAYKALYVAPDTDPDGSELQWDFCTVQKPLAVIGPVAPECLAPSAPELVPLGHGAAIAGPQVRLPDDACATFGPIPGDPKPGTPPSRPTDPDPTGGYYQPVVLSAPGDAGPDYVVGVTRLNCGLGGATQQQAIDYAERYRQNENPVIDTLTMKRASGDEEALADDSAAVPTVVEPGEHVTFTASWAACPTAPSCGDGVCTSGESDTSCAEDCKGGKGCTGSETYPVLNTESHALSDHRETLRVSWFASAGQFSHDSTGKTEAQALDAFTDNAWVAPATPGPLRLWVVIRDDRGGSSWKAFQLDVRG